MFVLTVKIYFSSSLTGHHVGSSLFCSVVIDFGRKEMFYLTTLNTIYLRLYGVRHMVKNHSYRERANPLPPHGLLYPITARVLLYASSHRQNDTNNGLCYTSRGALVGTRNSPMGPPWRIDPATHRTMSERSYHGATSCPTMKDRSDDPSHHERTLLPRSYISLWLNSVTGSYASDHLH